MEYENSPGGLPFPARTVSTVSLSGDPAQFQQEQFEIKRVAFGDPPAEWFKLSGYGLPDLPLHPSPRSSAFSLRSPWLWGSLVTALVSFGLLRLLRRKRVTASAG
jgi:hypothetical protein